MRRAIAWQVHLVKEGTSTREKRKNNGGGGEIYWERYRHKKRNERGNPLIPKGGLQRTVFFCGITGVRERPE